MPVVPVRRWISKQPYAAKAHMLGLSTRNAGAQAFTTMIQPMPAPSQDRTLMPQKPYASATPPLHYRTYPDNNLVLTMVIESVCARC